MRCQYDCSYCWSEALKNGRLKNSPHYQKLASNGNTCYLVEKELKRHFKAGDYVFVEDCGDLFASDVPDLFIQQVLLTIWDDRNKDAKFLLLTKNPWRYLMFQKMIPDNCLCGATIETTRSVRAWSKAPAPCNRFRAMKRLGHPHKAIIIEPIMDFNLQEFVFWLDEIHPELIVIGYDNYHHGLPEPSLKKTQQFIEVLKEHGHNIQTKTLREKWNG